MIRGRANMRNRLPIFDRVALDGAVEIDCCRHLWVELHDVYPFHILHATKMSNHLFNLMGNLCQQISLFGTHNKSQPINYVVE